MHFRVKNHLLAVDPVTYTYVKDRNKKKTFTLSYHVEVVPVVLELFTRSTVLFTLYFLLKINSLLPLDVTRLGREGGRGGKAFGYDSGTH